MRTDRIFAVVMGALALLTVALVLGLVAGTPGPEPQAAPTSSAGGTSTTTPASELPAPSGNPITQEHMGRPGTADIFDQAVLDAHGVDREEAIEVAAAMRESGVRPTDQEAVYQEDAAYAVEAVHECTRTEGAAWSSFERAIRQKYDVTRAAATTLTSYLRDDFCPSLEEPPSGPSNSMTSSSVSATSP